PYQHQMSMTLLQFQMHSGVHSTQARSSSTTYPGLPALPVLALRDTSSTQACDNPQPAVETLYPSVTSVNWVNLWDLWDLWWQQERLCPGMPPGASSLPPC